MNTNPSLSLMLQSARTEMINATTTVMQKYGIPAVLMDGVLSALLADIRAQTSAQIIRDLEQSAADEQPTTEDGENNG